MPLIPAPRASLELVVCSGATITVHPLPSQGTVRIGRDATSDICIEASSVSRKHALLHLGPPLRIEDLGSKSGTFTEGPPPSSADGATRDPRQLARQEVEVVVGEGILLGTVLIAVRRQAVPSDPPPVDAAFGKYVVRDPAMRALYEHAAAMAAGTLPLLLLGENGTGKEVLADWIHERSRRAKKPLLRLNCAAMPEALVEGELFGTVRGAFTGAVDRAGLFEAADGGTLFLDEVGELTLPIQAKLLRVLEYGEVTRVGARAPRKIDVRFLAATNRDLAQAIQDKTFRQDLFFRLKGETICIPPLRERISEIVPLAELFLKRACVQLERARVPAISTAAQALLQRHPWPGNVRELRHAMDRAALLCAYAPEVLPQHLPAELGIARAPVVPKERAGEPLAPPSAPVQGNLPSEIEKTTREIERRRILDALASCHGNQTRAAKLLGIARRTLLYKMKEYEIPGPR